MGLRLQLNRKLLNLFLFLFQKLAHLLFRKLVRRFDMFYR